MLAYRNRNPSKSLSSTGFKVIEDCKSTLQAKAMERKQSLEDKFNQLKEEMIQNIKAYTNITNGLK